MIACLALCSYVSAAGVTSAQEDRLQALEESVKGGYNPSLVKKSGVYVGGDVLYWTARETGLAYAMQVDSQVILLPSKLNYQVLQPQYDWDFGFRVTGGVNFEPNGWDLGVTWTRFFTRASERGSPSAHSGFIPIFSFPGFTVLHATANKAEADWKLLYNEIDVTVGKGYYVSKYFVLRPFLGPSGLWIDQHYDLEYEQTSLFFTKDVVKLHNGFEGVGLNGGLDLRFCFRGGWGIYGKVAGGIYYGSFDLKRDEHIYGSPDGVEHFDTKHKLHIGAPTLSAAMGFSWDRSYAKDRCYVSVKLLWEHLLFYSQNQFFRFITPNANPALSSFVSNQGDLTMQGGTFSATFGF